MSAALIIIRSVVFFLLQFVLTVIFSLIAICTAPFQPMTRYHIISVWSRLIVLLAKYVCGISYRVIGAEHLPKTPSIVMSKHQSAWETLAFQEIFPPQVWVLKRELLRLPFFGWGLAMMSPIAIDRNAGIKALKQTAVEGRDRLSRGFWIVVFPEGTRIPPGERGHYHIGGAWLAAQAGVPVVPVAHNAGTVWPKSAFMKQPGTITVSIGPAIEAKGIKPEQLNRQVEDWIENEVARLGSARG